MLDLRIEFNVPKPNGSLVTNINSKAKETLRIAAMLF
jgi:hypothetical protein